MAGYIRQDVTNNIADGNVINASDFDNEYNAIEAAFHASTGHTHDGTSAEGAPITKIGPTQDVVASASALTPKTDNTVDLGSSTLEYKDLWIDGTANIDSLVADTADINAGTIDGTTIGGSSAAAGTFTTATATTGNITTVNATTVDTTNIEVTTLKAKDGTSAGSIADSTGVVTLASSVLTTTDINGGTIDGVTIGGASAGAGTFTTLTTSSTVTLNGGTANGVLYLNGSKVATSGSALTFDGTYLGVVGDITVRTGIGYQNAINDSTSVIKNSGSTGVGNLQFDVGGTEQMRLTSTGLGIGTSSPSAKLTIAGTAATTSQVLNSTGSTTGATYGRWFNTGSDLVWGIESSAGGALLTGSSAYAATLYTNSAVPLQFGTAGTVKATLDSSGNLGIGTTSPQRSLHVNGSTGAMRLQGTSVGGYIEIVGPSNTNFIGTPAAISSGSTTDLAFYISSAERMRLDSSGNLGLGVTPSAWNSSCKTMQIGPRLGIYDTGTTGAFVYNAYINTSGNFIYSQTAAAALYDTSAGQHRWYTAPSGTAGNAISFTQAMTLDASGNLQIGRTTSSGSPYKLELNSTADTRFALSVGTTLTGGIDAAANLMTLVAYGVSTPMTFQVNGSERMRLDSSGNLGLGVTPSAWRAADRALQVRSTVVENVNNSASSFGTNYYRDASSVDRYLNTNFAAQYVQNYGDNGSHVWLTAPSGTAGNTISFTQAMTLDASGNLTVGATGGEGVVRGHSSADGTVASFRRLGATYNTGLFVGNVEATQEVSLNASGSGGVPFFTFKTSNTERMRLDSSGNLGLGVTPSAWGTSEYKAAQIGNGASFYGRVASGDQDKAGMSSNAYNNGSNWLYIATDSAAKYDQIGGGHYWYTAPSGTAGNAISFTQAMTLGADGNLAVGTTTTTAGRFTVAGGNGIIVNGNGASGYNGVQCINDNGITLTLTCGGSTAAGWAQNSATVGTTTNHALLLGTNNTERARITSGGDLLVGDTSQPTSADNRVAIVGTRGIDCKNTGGATAPNITAWNNATTGDNIFISFRTETTDTQRGSITYNRGAGQVAYNITSDARLKENIADADDAGSKVDALQVRKFDWKETGNHVDYGFVAQELEPIVPHAVSKPDAEDEMWSVDYSKLVPMLIKEIQSLRARVAALEAA